MEYISERMQSPVADSIKLAEKEAAFWAETVPVREREIALIIGKLRSVKTERYIKGCNQMIKDWEETLDMVKRRDKQAKAVLREITRVSAVTLNPEPESELCGFIKCEVTHGTDPIIVDMLQPVDLYTLVESTIRATGTDVHITAVTAQINLIRDISDSSAPNLIKTALHITRSV